MMTPPFLLIGVPVIVTVAASAYFATHPSLGQPTLLADAPALVSSSPAPAVSDSGKGGARRHHLLDQLDLTEAQKQQIAQLKQTITDHKERHRAILKVLTPEQRTRLKELRAAPSSPNTISTPSTSSAT